MNWKPPSITTRTAEYLRKIGHLSDADKLEYFDNIVGAAFRKGYNVRKGDELKMRGEKVHNVEVTGAARLYRAASAWTAGLGHKQQRMPR